jgi:UDP-glucose 4-epimerase
MTIAKVLITGGAGFIGSHLVELLIREGCFVKVLDNFRNGSREKLGTVMGSRYLKIIHGDVTDLTTCNLACREVDIVFHLACLGVRHSLYNPIENHQVNALGTLHMLESARQANIKRFVYVSSSEVYGRVREFPVTENSDTWPLTIYGSSKLAGEHYARSYFESFQVPTVCVRPFNNYGPRSHFAGDTGEVIPRFILRALKNLPPVIFGDGSYSRDFLYVGECAQALWKIARVDTLLGQVVNLGYGQETKIVDLAKLVLEMVGKKDLQPLYEARRPADVPRLWVDTRKIKETISFHPQVSLVEGLAQTIPYFVNYLKEHPDCLDELKTRNWEPE